MTLALIILNSKWLREFKKKLALSFFISLSADRPLHSSQQKVSEL